MRRISLVFLLVLAYPLEQSAFAQGDSKPVPMDQAAFHVPVFSNDYITLLSINIPPGRDTGFHTHYFDSVSVLLSAALRTNQVYGSSEISVPAIGNPPIPGRTSFTNVTENGPHTHKATNVGPTPFHIISFILKDREMIGVPVSDRSSIAGYTQIMDNERIRAWRVILEPAEVTGQIMQMAPGLRVYVRGGVLDEIVPGAADRGMASHDGDFLWQEAGQPRAVKNTGTTVVEFVEFEFK